MSSLSNPKHSSRSQTKVLPDSVSDRDTPLSAEDYQTVAMLTTLQYKEILRRLGALEQASHRAQVEEDLPRYRHFRDPVNERTKYSPIVRIAFKALTVLFWSFAGFALAYVLSVGLHAPHFVLDTLQDLASDWLLPLAALTLCTIAIAALHESLKSS